MLVARGLTKTFGTAAALEAVDLEIRRGETVALVGPSGCGKSTLLRCLLGLVPPDRGEVTFGAEPVNPLTVRRIRQRVGYVVQGGGLFPHLSALENVTLLGRHLGRSKDELAQRVETVRAQVRLPPELLERMPRQLSGGQAQRVSLMRALLLDPEVLLLDEPLGALDPITRFHLQQELKELFASVQRTVVIVTHDLAEAAYLGDRLVLMRAGRIEQQGPFEAFVHSPSSPFVTEFVRAHRPLPMGVAP